MILLIDNYDSFVHNLARYFQRLGQETLVVRNDAVTGGEVVKMKPSTIVISPGPCTPAEAGCSVDVIRQANGAIPVLGVCLGHQAIAAAYGARIVRAVEPMHGRASRIVHQESGLFEGLESPLSVGRYHSLVVERESLPAELEVTAETDDGQIMALAHRKLPIFGVQFHPESVLTECGYPILANFLRLAGIRSNRESPSASSERPPVPTPPELPLQPVTF
jgi:anthranilate synthase/aminodeoxychorismate synthase-like glutamine amidotransferase